MPTMTETPEIQLIKTEDLKPSPHNRRVETDDELKQLSASILESGVLHPLIVRKLDDGSLEIVSGHRRWAAAKGAGFENIPVVIKEYSDSQARIIQVTENVQRKNLGPIEEAKSFELLWGDGGYSVQSIADLVAKPAKYVHRALSLLTLPVEAQEFIDKGVLTAAHGHQLARVGKGQIETVIKFALDKGYSGEVPTVLELRREIERRVEKKLTAAPFVKDEAYADRIACLMCPSNTGNQGTLFDAAEEGSCTDGACFSTKLNQFYKDLADKGRKRWPGLKYVGAARSAYGNEQMVRGYVVIEEVDPKTKKALDEIAKNPEGAEAKKWGFGILKPSEWGKLKNPKLVVVKKRAEKAEDKSESKGEPRIEVVARQHLENQFLERYRTAALWESGRVFPITKRKILASVLVEGGWIVQRLGNWLIAAGINPAEAPKKIAAAVMKLGDDHTERLWYWVGVEVGTNGMEAEALTAEAQKVDLQKVVVEGRKKFSEYWKNNEAALVAEYKKSRGVR